jgi:hypothetical protein
MAKGYWIKSINVGRPKGACCPANALSILPKAGDMRKRGFGIQALITAL